MNLDECREKINGIDEKMLSLFEERMSIVKDVAEYKRQNAMNIEDKAREKVLKDNLSTKINDDIVRKHYITFINSVLDSSKAYQRELNANLKVAYCGEKGAFAYFALNKIFGSADAIKYDSFKEAYNSVKDSANDFAVLPIENSNIGEVSQIIDLLFQGELVITNVYDMPIDQALLGIEGSTVNDIKTVYSHPQALAQCREFLERHKIDIVEESSTSKAAKIISDKKDKNIGAIAAKEAAELFGLKVLQEKINGTRDNTTRFAVFSRSLNYSLKGDKAANFILTFTVKNEAGSLAQALSIISSYGYNLRCLRSRPMKELIWNYYFYVEAVGDVLGTNGTDMLRALSICCDKLKIAGVFKELS